MGLKRILWLAGSSCLLSLVLLLYFTYRNLGSPGELEINLMWGRLALTQAPEFLFLKPWFGEIPPPWVRTLGVLWHQASVLWWWWLPFLVALVQVLVRAWGRRKATSEKFRPRF